MCIRDRFADGVEIGKSKYNLKFHLSTDKTKHKQNGKYVANIATINTKMCIRDRPMSEMQAEASCK